MVRIASHPRGVNVIGHVSGNLGLGVAVRSTIARLLAWGHPVAVVDIDLGSARSRHDLSYASLKCDRSCSHPLTLFHMNPPEVIQFSEQWRPQAPLGFTNVCVPFWELPHLPSDWLAVLGAMDLVMAPSRFIRAAIGKNLPDMPVLMYPQAVSLPEDVRAHRSRWGFSEGAVTFLITFDPLSDIFRKNPSGAVEAFQRAFRSDESVALVIKLNASEQKVHPRTEQEIHRLRAAAGSDRRIRVVAENLTYADVLSLYASADVMVSLHRAEGFGLHLMEAMTLGKPVIATRWSGNMDFMTAENSCLVGYRLGPVRAVHPAYAAELARPEQVWAEPDIDEAAAWMRRLAGDAALRSAVGARAAQAMREWTATANVTSPFLAIENLVAAAGSVARLRRHAALNRLVWNRRVHGFLHRWKRNAGSALGIGSARG